MITTHARIGKSRKKKHISHIMMRDMPFGLNKFKHIVDVYALRPPWAMLERRINGNIDGVTCQNKGCWHFHVLGGYDYVTFFCPRSRTRMFAIWYTNLRRDSDNYHCFCITLFLHITTTHVRLINSSSQQNQNPKSKSNKWNLYIYHFTASQIQ